MVGEGGSAVSGEEAGFGLGHFGPVPDVEMAMVGNKAHEVVDPAAFAEEILRRADHMAHVILAAHPMLLENNHGNVTHNTVGNPDAVVFVVPAAHPLGAAEGTISSHFARFTFLW